MTASCEILKTSVEKIMEGAPVPRISRTRMACVAAICIITCSVFVACALARVREAPEQTARTKPGPTPPNGLEILTPHAGVDLTAFSNHLLDAIKRNWYVEMPEGAIKGDKGKVTVRFRIQTDGSLVQVPIVEVSSGKKPLDDAAVAAISASAPFEHLPESFKGPNIELRITFFYNLPPDRGEIK